MKKSLGILAISATLAGCVSSSGVFQLGPDTYSVSVSAAPARGGALGAKRAASSEAAEFCATKGKQVLVNNIISGYKSSEIVFMCLDSTDKDYVRPAYERSPDIILQAE